MNNANNDITQNQIIELSNYVAGFTNNERVGTTKVVSEGIDNLLSANLTLAKTTIYDSSDFSVGFAYIDVTFNGSGEITVKNSVSSKDSEKGIPHYVGDYKADNHQIRICNSLYNPSKGTTYTMKIELSSDGTYAEDSATITIIKS